MGTGLKLGGQLARAPLDHRDARAGRRAQELGGRGEPHQRAADVAPALLERTRLGAHPRRRLGGGPGPLGGGPQPGRVAPEPLRPFAQAGLPGGDARGGVGQLAAA